MHFLPTPLNPLWVKITPMEITPMKKNSNQIHGLSKGCLGIIFYFFSTKTVATGPEKVIGVVVLLNNLPIYNILFKYFNLIGLWALINEFLTVKGTVVMVGIPICSLWHMTSIRKASIFQQLVT